MQIFASRLDVIGNDDTEGIEIDQRLENAFMKSIKKFTQRE